MRTTDRWAAARGRSASRAAAACCLLALSAAARAETGTAPLWEAGIGAGAAYLPDYRGSREARVYPFPAPYFVYRGERLQVDRLGLRGALLRTPRWTLEASAGGNLPVDSSRNAARAGMDDLAPIVEAGVVARYRVFGEDDERLRLDLRVPLRMAFALERGVRDVGLVANPHLALDYGQAFGRQRWNVGLIAGVLFGDRRYHGHFYDVAPRHATAQRPGYDAPAGYGGPQLLLSVSRRFAGAWAGGFLRYDSVRGAAFGPSPLVTARSNLSAGFAVTWIVGASSTMVAATD